MHIYDARTHAHKKSKVHARMNTQHIHKHSQATIQINTRTPTVTHHVHSDVTEMYYISI